jgi:lipopolysaccharide export system permease protein
MSKIITTYLAREIFKTSSAMVLVLFIILMSNALGRVLADVADGDLPQQAVWPVMLSQSVNILSLLLPLGVFLGIIFAFGRMYKDHEIVVMNACGIGYADFYKPVALVLVPILLFSGYASITLNAQMNRHAELMVEQDKNQHEFQQVKPGQFNQSGNGDHMFFMESISADSLQLQEIIISQSGRENMILETARTGRRKIDETTGDLFLVVGPGQRYEGLAGKNNYTIIDFEQHGILLKNKEKQKEVETSSESKTFDELMRSKLKEDKIEMHWRIAVPMVLLTLAILAVPMSYVAPRQGRYGKVGYALLVYIVYLNLTAVTKVKLAMGEIPLAINFWWVHLLFLLLAAVLLYRRNHGFLSRARPVAL